jgi:uncharacterized protein (DUF1800 family)
MDKNASLSSLSKLSNPLSFAQARHLLDRCTFGAAKADIDAFTGKTISEALEILTANTSLPSPPISTDARDTDVLVGETWINTSDNSNFFNYRLTSLRSWWTGTLVTHQLSLTEKMTLFWHNHFALETVVVRRPRHLYYYVNLLRTNALGNFKTLMEEITISPAMLVYLDGDENRAGSPNENFGRELFELFSIGKGPLIGDGNYTNYTENDIKEAAKVLTGWQVNNTTSTSYFNTNRHDKTLKTFSAAFEGQSIGNNEANEYKNLISMIFAKKETARYLTRKLYRYFVYYKITPEIETSIIEPLASILYDNNYEVKPVVLELLGSEHFFSEGFMGASIKNPLEFTVGIFRKCQVQISSDPISNYQMWNTLHSQAASMEMRLGDPPDVAGWPQYYSEPQFNRLWINSATIPNRTLYSDKMFSGGYNRNGFKFYVNPLTLTMWISDPSDPNILIRELTAVLHPVDISQENINKLKEILIPGLPDFSWTSEWTKYVNNPTDTTQKNLILAALNSLLTAICRLPEFYLC